MAEFGSGGGWVYGCCCCDVDLDHFVWFKGVGCVGKKIP